MIVLVSVVNVRAMMGGADISSDTDGSDLGPSSDDD